MRGCVIQGQRLLSVEQPRCKSLPFDLNVSSYLYFKIIVKKKQQKNLWRKQIHQMNMKNQVPITKKGELHLGSISTEILRRFANRFVAGLYRRSLVCILHELWEIQILLPWNWFARKTLKIFSSHKARQLGFTAGWTHLWSSLALCSVPDSGTADQTLWISGKLPGPNLISKMKSLFCSSSTQRPLNTLQPAWNFKFLPWAHPSQNSMG